MEILVSLHARFGTAIVYYLLALGAWGILLGARGRGPSSSYRGALVIAEIVAVAQGALGVLALVARPPANSLHLLYGVALALALPLAATYVRGRTPRQTSLVFGLVAFFAAGLAIRGLTTA